MRKFTIYLKENENSDSNLNTEIRDMVQNSLKTSDSKTVEDFIKAYNTDPESNQIEGLINKADIYDFYLKYMEDIDEILFKNDFYNKSATELNIHSLYDYVIEGTKKAVNFSINGSNVPDKDF